MFSPRVATNLLVACVVLGLTARSSSAEPYCPGYERTLTVAEWTGQNEVTVNPASFNWSSAFYYLNGLSHPDKLMYPCDEFRFEVTATRLPTASGPQYGTNLAVTLLAADGSTLGSGANMILSAPSETESASYPTNGSWARGTPYVHTLLGGVEVSTTSLNGGVRYTFTVHLRSRQGYNRGGSSMSSALTLQNTNIILRGEIRYGASRQWYRATVPPSGQITVDGTLKNLSSTTSATYYTMFNDSAGASLKTSPSVAVPALASVTFGGTGHRYTNNTATAKDVWISFYDQGWSGPLDFQIRVQVTGLPEPILSLFLDVLDPGAQFDFNSSNPQSDLSAFVPGARQHDDSAPSGPKKGTSVPLPQAAQVIAAYIDATGHVEAPPSSGNVTFSMTGVSAFDGIAMNAALPSGAPVDDIVATSATSVSFGGDNTARLSLAIWDYGGFGIVVASHGSLAEFMRLPKSDDGDWIPDVGWRVFEFGQERDPVTDSVNLDGEDTDSSVNPNTAGDGLSRFEEFRGFFVYGDHQRTDPAHQDVFAYTDFGVEGIGDADTLPLRWHLINATEHSSKKIAPFFRNANAASGGDIPGHFVGTLFDGVTNREQQIISIAKNDLLPWPMAPPYFVGLTDSDTDGQGNAVLGPPWTIGSGAAVFTRRIRAISPTHSDDTISDDVDTQKTRQTIAHEIGHNLAMDDVPQSCPPVATTVMVDSYFSPSLVIDCAWGAIPHQYDPSDHAQLRVR